MRRTILTLAAVLCVATASVELAAQIPDRETQTTAVESMLERRRWGDARVALNSLVAELDPIKDKRQMEWAEYQMVRCVVELGIDDAVQYMEHFLERYPSSLYRNSVAFMIACHECDNGNFERADELFLEVDYKALSAREKERYDIRVGYICFLAGDNIAANNHFKRISTVSEYYPHALYFRSYIAYIDGSNLVAEEGFKELAGYSMYADLAPYYLLQLEYRRGNYNEVIAEGEKLIKRASSETYADLVRIIAESYFIKGD